VVAARCVPHFAIEKTTSVLVCKRRFVTADRIRKSDPMYLYAVRLLLERLSWIARDLGATEMIVTFAHIKRFKTDRLHDYRDRLEQQHGRPGMSIDWELFRGHPFRFGAMRDQPLLEIADFAASSIAAAINPDRLNVTEARYLRESAPAIYRRGADVTRYGLKTFPEDPALGWLKTL